MTYINMDFGGLQEITARLIAGEEIEIEADGFENDLERFKGKDDVLTLLVHLGYLTYHEETKTVRIPNKEIRIEFSRLIKNEAPGKKWLKLIEKSNQLLNDTLAGDAQALAEAIEHYLKVEEMPSGRGIADVVYIPKPRSLKPALIIELKWNKTAEGAIDQIRRNRYPAVLQEFKGEILCVGISYNEKTKEHSCVIERA